MVNMENIIGRMRALYPVSDEALDLFVPCLERCVFPAKTIIIQADRVDKRVYFIERGITRSYCLSKGKEVTTWFSAEGDGTCGSLALYRNRPCFEYVETLEPTEACLISTDTLNSLYGRHIDLANWGRVMQQENFLRMQDLHISRLNLSARERYEQLTKEYPNICNRVNLGYIASFLGVTQPSLSRIRAGHRRF